MQHVSGQHVSGKRRFRGMLAAGAIGLAVAAAGLLSTPVAAQSPPQSPCTCRAAGVSHALDACTCLNTPAGPRIACCGKVLNNTAWRFTEQRCPTAHAPRFKTTALLQNGAPERPPSPPHQSPWRLAAQPD